MLSSFLTACMLLQGSCPPLPPASCQHHACNAVALTIPSVPTLHRSVLANQSITLFQPVVVCVPQTLGFCLPRIPCPGTS